MKVRLHWSIGTTEDSIDIQAPSEKGIREQIEGIMKRRGLDAIKNDLWTEDVK